MILMRPPEKYPSDIEMESVGSHHGRSNEYDPDDTGLTVWRRPFIASTETEQRGGFTTQRIRMSAIAEIKEFSGRDNDEDRARSWVSKAKSAFLRDQAPEMENAWCLVICSLVQLEMVYPVE